MYIYNNILQQHFVYFKSTFKFDISLHALICLFGYFVLFVAGLNLIFNLEIFNIILGVLIQFRNIGHLYNKKFIFTEQR